MYAIARVQNLLITDREVECEKKKKKIEKIYARSRISSGSTFENLSRALKCEISAGDFPQFLAWKRENENLARRRGRKKLIFEIQTRSLELRCFFEVTPRCERSIVGAFFTERVDKYVRYARSCADHCVLKEPIITYWLTVFYHPLYHGYHVLYFLDVKVIVGIWRQSEIWFSTVKERKRKNLFASDKADFVVTWQWRANYSAAIQVRGEKEDTHEFEHVANRDCLVATFAPRVLTLQEKLYKKAPIPSGITELFQASARSFLFSSLILR